MNIDNNPIEVLINALPDRRLELGKDADGKYICSYAGADISDPPVRRADIGRGRSVYAAAEDYIRKISGKKLIFGYGENRKEVAIAVLQTERHFWY